MQDSSLFKFGFKILKKISKCIVLQDVRKWSFDMLD